MLIQDTALPALRSDIQLNEAPPEPEGSPTWTLYDPAANKYYKIGWLEFECLVRFKKCKTVKALVKKVRAETTLEPEEDTVNALITFLVMNNLVHVSSEEGVNFFETQRERTVRPWWEKLLHTYLFFMIPLFKPQQFLEKTYPLLAPFFTRTFANIILILLAYGLFLSAQRADEMATTFMNYFNIEGVILFLGVTILVKIIHELGHAYMATKYGVPVTTIGLAFIVMYPILYTETTNAWKLQSRRDRLMIAAAGMMAELVLATVALILWHVLSPGMAQSICFMIAVVSMLASLMINLNPLMRFDGYYLFSDLVGVDNLQDRSFAFAKWQLRKWLWNWNDPLPEAVRKEKQKFLTGFGFSILVYRFFLYLGIALLVNHLFFQPLGFMMMMVELVFFIALPIWRELRVWVERSGDLATSLRGKITAIVLVLTVILFFVPLHRSIEIPAIVHAENYTRFYAAVPAQVEEMYVTQGQRVQKGDVLMRLSSRQLEHNIKISRQRVRDLEDIKMSSQATPELAKKRVMIDNEIDVARKEMEGFLELRKKLEIVAPFPGTVKMMDPALRPGQWVNTQTMLALLADDSVQTLTGYVSEQDKIRLAESKEGRFYLESSPMQVTDVILTSVDQTGAYEIFWPELSSVQGGAVAAERDTQGRIRPLPRHTVYAVHFSKPYENENNLFPNFIARGTVRLEAKPASFANLLIKKAISVFVMEGGF